MNATKRSGRQSARRATAQSLLVAFLVLASFAAAAGAQPQAVPDDYTTTEGTVLSVGAPGVLINDLAVRDVDEPMSARAVTLPSSGSLELASSGGFTYSPVAGFTGSDSFTYVAEQGPFVSEPATVTITVFPSTTIEAGNDHYTVPLSGSLSVAAPGVLANDQASDGATLQVDLGAVTGPSEGSLTLHEDGSFSYVVATGSTATADSFTYVATDGTVQSNTATVVLALESEDEPQPDDGVRVRATFEDVADVAISTLVAKAALATDPTVGSVISSLRITGSTRAVVTGSGLAEPLPAETATIFVVNVDGRFEEAARAAFDRCEKLALLAQARPEKYDLAITLFLVSTPQLVQATEERIFVRLPDGDVACSLSREGILTTPEPGGDEG